MRRLDLALGERGIPVKESVKRLGRRLEIPATDGSARGAKEGFGIEGGDVGMLREEGGRRNE